MRPSYFNVFVLLLLFQSLQWFPLDSLPSHKRDQISKTQLGLNPNTFFMVIPFVK